MSLAWVAPAIAFALAAVLTRVLSRTRTGFFAMLDIPNERSLHERPTPRGGGLAIVAGAVAAGCWVAVFFPPAQGAAWVFGAAVLVGSASLLDDKFTVPPQFRLLAHLLAGVALVLGGLTPELLVLPGLTLAWPGGVAALVSVLFVGWMINLYNFMDGMDGFAGGMGVFGFGTFAVIGAIAGHVQFAVSSAVLCTACAGFVVSNFPPARIFMGDVGSSILGLAAATLTLWAEREGLFPVWVGILVFSPFVVDATVTLGRRVLRREKVWHAHKTHFYQRLVQLGWGHRKTVLAEYGIMASCSVSAAVAAFVESLVVQWTVITVWGCVYCAIMIAVTMGERRAAT